MKRILALCDFQADFLAHTVLTGLWEMSGVEVYEMPILQSVRGKIDEGYDLPDGKRGMTGCTGYLQPNPLPEQPHTIEEVFDLGADHFDLVVALSTRDYVRRSLQTLIANGWDISNKLVVCDGEDGPFIDREFLRQWKPQILFKREMTRDYSIPAYWSAYDLPVMPLQFGAFTRSLPKTDDLDKKYDISCSLGRTNPIRDKLLIALLETVYDKQVCASGRAWLATNSDSPLVTEHKYGLHLHDLLPWTEYMALQGQSKIGVSVVGFGRDCLHSWELFSQRTLALYQDTGLHIPHQFINGKHCSYITEGDFPKLHTIIKYYLENEGQRNFIARAGRDHCRKYHSTSARAKYMIDIAIKIIGGEKIRLEDYDL